MLMILPSRWENPPPFIDNFSGIKTCSDLTDLIDLINPIDPIDLTRYNRYNVPAIAPV
ncbi:hypothetical protein L249_3777, partial [Ophiocordyceps polyrhachis-furcata BCC 54312]